MCYIMCYVFINWYRKWVRYISFSLLCSGVRGKSEGLNIHVRLRGETEE